jgi:hypothetical protein
VTSDSEPPLAPEPPAEGSLQASRLTIRFRLGRALALALLPVLILGALQSAAAFRRDAEERRARLILGAEQAAGLARARLENATVLLEVLAPDSVGLACAQRLRRVRDRLGGYDNLIRFTRTGRVACAADSVPANPDRNQSAWFERLEAGDHLAVVSRPAGRLAERRR